MHERINFTPGGSMHRPDERPKKRTQKEFSAEYRIPQLDDSDDSSLALRLLTNGLGHVLVSKERHSERFERALREAEARFSADEGSPFHKDKVERLARFTVAGALEKQFAQGVAQIVVRGREDKQWYEAFDVQEITFEENSDWIWLHFPGLSSIDGQREIGIIPSGSLDMIPPQGTGYAFVGPGAIAGYDSDQCRRVTEQVLTRAREITRQHPAKRVGVFCYSAGTHLGTYVANQLNKEHADAALSGPPPVQKFISMATGVSIAYGIQSTQVTDYLATDLERRGITKYDYDKAIADLTQKENLDFLPKGENCVVFAGCASPDGSHEGDSFIPHNMEGGTDDLVRLMEEKGLEPTYLMFAGKDHVTMPLHIILQLRAGLDPYLLGTSLAEYMAKNPPPLSEEKYAALLSEFIDEFTDEELRYVGHVLSLRNGKDGMQEFDAERVLNAGEQKLVGILIERGICAYRPRSMHPAAPPLLTVLEPDAVNIFKGFVNVIRAERDIAEIVGFINELDNGRTPREAAEAS